ncbi:uncharacterized protein LOC123549585 isoform X2 [Mercenaria mercenaria]|uniref:uncharacterized protein LOC123549585 isoform X2 n=2 Tax=Mercenaria mercenaria TaxID=6596 RepID=UPI00234E42B3|nr:uncharacterized protein LOC123549585 isoform X2 [Mercenaria mercenaria]
MRLKWNKSFKFMTRFTVILIILNTLRNTYRKHLTKFDSVEHSTLLTDSSIRERVSFNRLNVSQLKKCTDRITLNYKFLNVTSSCKAAVFPSHLARKPSWRAADKNNQSYVFSAYVLRKKRQIVIVGITQEGSSKYYCQIWNQNFGRQNMKMEEEPAKVVTLPEGRSLRYNAVLFQCMLPQSVELPTHVSLVSRSCETPMNLLDIQYVRSPYVDKHRFTVCLSPLNFRYNRDYEIIEWVELNRILGADKFIIYNYSSAINVARVLDYYSERGLTEVVQWNLPVGVDTWPRENKTVEIYYFGQIAALHDCLYRNKGVSEFIVNLDVDEFIIPHGINVTKWSDMLMQLKQDSNVYLFRNTFFKKEWNNVGIEIQNKSLVDKHRLVTLQKLQHETEIFSPRSRSKYFAKADGVFQVMIHEVPWMKNAYVPIEIRLLHHYRDWETLDDPPNVKVLDKTVPQKFGQLLIKNVQTVWSDLNIINNLRQ